MCLNCFISFFTGAASTLEEYDDRYQHALEAHIKDTNYDSNPDHDGFLYRPYIRTKRTVNDTEKVETWDNEQGVGKHQIERDVEGAHKHPPTNVSVPENIVVDEPVAKSVIANTSTVDVVKSDENSNDDDEKDAKEKSSAVPITKDKDVGTENNDPDDTWDDEEEDDSNYANFDKVEEETMSESRVPSDGEDLDAGAAKKDSIDSPIIDSPINEIVRDEKDVIPHASQDWHNDVNQDDSKRTMKTDSSLDTQDDNYDYDDSNTEGEGNNYNPNEKTNARNIIPGRKTIIPSRQNNAEVWDYDMGKEVVKIRPGYNPLQIENSIKRTATQNANKRTLLPARNPNVWDFDGDGKEIFKVPAWENNEKRTQANPYERWELSQPELYGYGAAQKRTPSSIGETHKIRPSSYLYMKSVTPGRWNTPELPTPNYYKRTMFLNRNTPVESWDFGLSKLLNHNPKAWTKGVKGTMLKNKTPITKRVQIPPDVEMRKSNIFKGFPSFQPPPMERRFPPVLPNAENFRFQDFGGLNMIPNAAALNHKSENVPTQAEALALQNLQSDEFTKERFIPPWNAATLARMNQANINPYARQLRRPFLPMNKAFMPLPRAFPNFGGFFPKPRLPWTKKLPVRGDKRWQKFAKNIQYPMVLPLNKGLLPDQAFQQPYRKPVFAMAAPGKQFDPWFGRWEEPQVTKEKKWRISNGAGTAKRKAKTNISKNFKIKPFASLQRTAAINARIRNSSVAEKKTMALRNAHPSKKHVVKKLRVPVKYPAPRLPDLNQIKLDKQRQAMFPKKPPAGLPVKYIQKILEPWEYGLAKVESELNKVYGNNGKAGLLPFSTTDPKSKVAFMNLQNAQRGFVQYSPQMLYSSMKKRRQNIEKPEESEKPSNTVENESHAAPRNRSQRQSETEDFEFYDDAAAERRNMVPEPPIPIADDRIKKVADPINSRRQNIPEESHEIKPMLQALVPNAVMEEYMELKKHSIPNKQAHLVRHEDARILSGKPGFAIQRNRVKPILMKPAAAKQAIPHNVTGAAAPHKKLSIMSTIAQYAKYLNAAKDKALVDAQDSPLTKRNMTGIPKNSIIIIDAHLKKSQLAKKIVSTIARYTRYLKQARNKTVMEDALDNEDYMKDSLNERHYYNQMKSKSALQHMIAHVEGLMCEYNQLLKEEKGTKARMNCTAVRAKQGAQKEVLKGPVGLKSRLKVMDKNMADLGENLLVNKPLKKEKSNAKVITAGGALAHAGARPGQIAKGKDPALHMTLSSLHNGTLSRHAKPNHYPAANFPADDHIVHNNPKKFGKGMRKVINSTIQDMTDQTVDELAHIKKHTNKPLSSKPLRGKPLSSKQQGIKPNSIEKLHQDTDETPAIQQKAGESMASTLGNLSPSIGNQGTHKGEKVAAALPGVRRPKPHLHKHYGDDEELEAKVSNKTRTVQVHTVPVNNPTDSDNKTNYKPSSDASQKKLPPPILAGKQSKPVIPPRKMKAAAPSQTPKNPSTKQMAHNSSAKSQQKAAQTPTHTTNVSNMQTYNYAAPQTNTTSTSNYSNNSPLYQYFNHPQYTSANSSKAWPPQMSTEGSAAAAAATPAAQSAPVSSYQNTNTSDPVVASSATPVSGWETAKGDSNSQSTGYVGSSSPNLTQSVSTVGNQSQVDVNQTTHWNKPSANSAVNSATPVATDLRKTSSKRLGGRGSRFRSARKHFSAWFGGNSNSSAPSQHKSLKNKLSPTETLLQFAKGIGINHFISNDRDLRRHMLANLREKQSAAHLFRGSPREVAYIKQKPLIGDSKRRGDIALTAGGERPLRKPVAIPPAFYSGINKMLQAMSHDNANKDMKDALLNENGNLMNVNNPMNPLNPLIESMKNGRLMNQALSGMRRSPASLGTRKDIVNTFSENSTNESKLSQYYSDLYKSMQEYALLSKMNLLDTKPMAPKKAEVGVIVNNTRNESQGISNIVKEILKNNATGGKLPKAGVNELIKDVNDLTTWINSPNNENQHKNKSVALVDKYLDVMLNSSVGNSTVSDKTKSSVQENPAAVEVAHKPTIENGVVKSVLNNTVDDRAIDREMVYRYAKSGDAKARFADLGIVNEDEEPSAHQRVLNNNLKNSFVNNNNNGNDNNNNNHGNDNHNDELSYKDTVNKYSKGNNNNNNNNNNNIEKEKHFSEKNSNKENEDKKGHNMNDSVSSGNSNVNNNKDKEKSNTDSIEKIKTSVKNFDSESNSKSNSNDNSNNSNDKESSSTKSKDTSKNVKDCINCVPKSETNTANDKDSSMNKKANKDNSMDNRKESMSNDGTNKNEPPVDILKKQTNQDQGKDDKTGKMKHILFKLKNSIYNSMKMYNLLLKASNKQEAQEEEVKAAADAVNDATKPKETIHGASSASNTESSSSNNNNNKGSSNTDSLMSAASATLSKAQQNNSNLDDNNVRMGRILNELKNSIDNSELIMKIYNLLLSAGKGKNETAANHMMNFTRSDTDVDSLKQMNSDKATEKEYNNNINNMNKKNTSIDNHGANMLKLSIQNMPETLKKIMDSDNAKDAGKAAKGFNDNENFDGIDSRHHKMQEDNSLVNNALNNKQTADSLLHHMPGDKNADVVKIDNYTVPVENEGMLKIAQKLTNNISTADDYPKPKPPEKPKPKPINDDVDEKVKQIQDKEETKEKKVDTEQMINIQKISEPSSPNKDLNVGDVIVNNKSVTNKPPDLNSPHTLVVNISIDLDKNKEKGKTVNTFPISSPEPDDNAHKGNGGSGGSEPSKGDKGGDKGDGTVFGSNDNDKDQNPNPSPSEGKGIEAKNDGEGKGVGSEGKGIGTEGKGPGSEEKGIGSEGKGIGSEGKGIGSEGKGIGSEGKGIGSESKGITQEFNEGKGVGTDATNEAKGVGSDGKGIGSEPSDFKKILEGKGESKQNLETKIHDGGLGHRGSNISSQFDCDCSSPKGEACRNKCNTRSSGLTDEGKDTAGPEKSKADLLDRYFDAMGNAAKTSEKSDASAKTEVTSTPKKENDVSNNLIENQWNKVKTNIDNLREDASAKPNSLDHLDQYFTQVDVPKINSFTKNGDSGKKDKIKETLVFINDMEKEIDSLIEENKKHDAFLDLTRQEKNKIQKVFSNLQQMQDQAKEEAAKSSENNSQKKDVSPVNNEEDVRKSEDAKKSDDEERQRKDSELSYKRRPSLKTEDQAPRYLTYLNQLKKDKINRQNDSTVTGEKRKLQKKGKSQVFAELVGDKAEAPKKEESSAAKKSATKSKKKGKKATIDVKQEAAKIAENFMDDSYTTLDSVERSKAHGGKVGSVDGIEVKMAGGDGMAYDGTPARNRNEEYGGVETSFSPSDYAEESNSERMEVFENGAHPSAPLKPGLDSQGGVPSSTEYVEGESEKYLVQPMSPGAVSEYDDPTAATTRTKLHNIYDNVKPQREPMTENRAPKYDARSELIMPADNIYGMLSKGSKMDHVTHHMTPSAYETKVSKAEIEAKDKLDELRQAQYVEKLQKAEMGEALSDLKEVTQNGLKTMFADAVGKQNNFINSVSNYNPNINPNIPRSFNGPPLNEFIEGPGEERRYGNEINTNLPGPEDETGDREFSPDVPMYGQIPGQME